jgi:hypothetical protein
MFAYPVVSPLQPAGHIASENAYQVAYLQAISPEQSETSRYHLEVMDRDGSNRVQLFPPEGAQGLDPQRVAWSPSVMVLGGAAGETANQGLAHFVVAVLYQDNIWLVDTVTDQTQQITGDGLTSRIDWK